MDSEQIFIDADKIKSYFDNDEKELAELYDKLKKLQMISDKQIDTIAEAAPGRGTQHYLIEHITNAISIQNQMQSVLKDKRQIKEKALDIVLKSNNNEKESGDSEAILLSLQKLIKDEKSKVNTSINKIENRLSSIDEKTLDDEIEKKLGI